MATAVEFTAHNIRLDDGTFTKPEQAWTMDQDHWFRAAKRLLDVAFPGDKSHLRIADLGCLEGGFTTEFARMGFQAVGLEVRETNLVACRHVQENTDLPNLSFVQDDAWNVGNHGPFDVIFCCGLYYHIDRPKQFLKVLSDATTRMLILQTHFSTDRPSTVFNLSELDENEGLQGRWFTEFRNEDEFADRDNHRWASWDNHRSFWVRREHLLQAIRDVGFQVVLEQFDGLGDATQAGSMLESLVQGYYRNNERGTFVGIKAAG